MYTIEIKKISLRWLKVAILPFSDIFLIDNGTLANSTKLWPIPLNLEESASGICHFKIASFSRLSRINIFMYFNNVLNKSELKWMLVQSLKILY